MSQVMKDPTYWADKRYLTEHLAEQLTHGRLSMLLGAGVSSGFGLPNWTTLVSRMSKRARILDPFSDPLNRIQVIRNRYNKLDFIDCLYTSLYEDVTLDFEKLFTHRLLLSIASLAMSSRRGSASQIITLNFDDILETFLEYFGFVVTSVEDGRHWAPSGDVVVYHPHGFVPLSKGRKRSDDVVFGTSDFFAAIRDDAENVWRQTMRNIFRTHTCIHIGLSGDDINVASHLFSLENIHAKKGSLPYHTVWFQTKNGADKDRIEALEGIGVYTCLLDGWDELPSFLFSICQKAAKISLM